jgi:hypothetical protein
MEFRVAVHNYGLIHIKGTSRSACQGTPAVVPMRANIHTSALNKGGSGDPGTRSIVGRARARTSGIRYIY